MTELCWRVGVRVKKLRLHYAFVTWQDHVGQAAEKAKAEAGRGGGARRDGSVQFADKGKIEARRYTFALESLALRMGHGLPVLYRAFWSWQEITRKQTRRRLCSDPLPAIFTQVSLPLLVSESNGSKMPSESRIQSPETLAQDVGGISSAQMDGCY
jgi:hypothetical protein